MGRGPPQHMCLELFPEVASFHVSCFPWEAPQGTQHDRPLQHGSFYAG